MTTTYAGMDAHAATIRVAVLAPGAERPEEWQLTDELRAVKRLAQRLKRMAPGPVVACYEAGPGGFALQRQLEAEGIECQVIAPALIPTRPGDRVKTDRRELAACAASDDYREAVGLLRCFRGVDTVTAMTVLAELGDVTRFGSARQLMSYLGLTPSEYSSGARQRRGPITKTGNSHVRRILAGGAWHYRHPPRRRPGTPQARRGPAGLGRGAGRPRAGPTLSPPPAAGRSRQAVGRGEHCRRP